MFACAWLGYLLLALAQAVLDFEESPGARGSQIYCGALY